MPEKIAAVVVTFNRKFLLKQCLDSILLQTIMLSQVIVIDNLSTDGTPEFLEENGYLCNQKINYVRLDKNIGGAGGFYTGIKLAYEQGYEWIWIMDDDTIPAPSALEDLLAVVASPRGLPKPVLLASKVLWVDNSLHPMNRPRFFVDRVEQFLEAATRGLVLLRSTSFVSLMIHRDAIEKHGLPLKHYFIWNDDSEFTARILKTETGYLVPESVVYHKTSDKYTTFSDKSGKYYYHVRNTLFMLKTEGWEFYEKVKLFIALCWDINMYLNHNEYRLGNIGIVLRGMIDGVFFEKKAVERSKNC